MGSLVAAYTIAWAILMFYLFTLARRQRRMRQQIAQMQAGHAAPETGGETKADTDAR